MNGWRVAGDVIDDWPERLVTLLGHASVWSAGSANADYTPTLMLTPIGEAA
jgi:hypothetical protein